MTDRERSQAETAAETRADAAEAEASLSALGEAGEETAGLIAEAFQNAGDAISDALADAARGGALSFREMAEAIATDMARALATDLISTPLRGFAQFAGQAVTGQRAEGGPVLAGERYLVGERGPEVFTPGQAGAISPVASAPPVTVIVNAGADAAESVRRSERQIAAAIARAAMAGRRSL